MSAIPAANVMSLAKAFVTFMNAVKQSELKLDDKVYEEFAEFYAQIMGTAIVKPARKSASPAKGPLCKGTVKKTGTPCTKAAKEGSEYCGIHGKTSPVRVSATATATTTKTLGTDETVPDVETSSDEFEINE